MHKAIIEPQPSATLRAENNRPSILLGIIDPQTTFVTDGSGYHQKREITFVISLTLPNYSKTKQIIL